MTLSLVFRIQAVIMGIFGAAALLAPGSMMGSFNVEATSGAVDVMRGMSLMVIAVAYISWQMPTWAGDNLKSVGMFFAVWHHIAPIALFSCTMSSGILYENGLKRTWELSKHSYSLLCLVEKHILTPRLLSMWNFGRLLFPMFPGTPLSRVAPSCLLGKGRKSCFLRQIVGLCPQYKPQTGIFSTR